MARRAALVGLLLTATAAPLASQQRVCDFSSVGRTEGVEQAGVQLILLHDPFEVRCSDGALLRARSGTLNQLARELILVGNVFFQDPDQTLTSDHATYNSLTGRLYATGNVVFTNRAEGSTLTGPELEYYRAMEGRPEAQVLARQRPHLVVRPEAGAEDEEPLEIDADEVRIFGQDDLHATGNVVITRTDLDATAAEAEYDKAAGDLELRGDARVRSREYDLAGEVIQGRLVDGDLEEVHARTNASLAGEDLTVRAPEVRLFLEEDRLQRAVARIGRSAEPGVRAIAFAPEFRLEADSLDAVLPGQQLERVYAIGNARGEALDTTAVDTLAPPASDSLAAPPPAAGLAERDWIMGDTIIGFFARADSLETPAEPGDTSVVLTRLLAMGSALSLYRVEREDAPPGTKRGINFLSGDTIDLSFAKGELELAEVHGLRRGLYLDPVPANGSTPPGTARREEEP